MAKERKTEKTTVRVSAYDPDHHQRAGVSLDIMEDVPRVVEKEFKEDPEDFMKRHIIIFNYTEGFKKKYPNTSVEFSKAVGEIEMASQLKNWMIANNESLNFYLEESEKESADGKTIYYPIPAIDKLSDAKIKELFKKGGGALANADALAANLKTEKKDIDEERASHIRANYAPYYFATPIEPWDNVGSTIVDPNDTDFVFTDAMNGCAWAITKVDADENKFEGWHFQSASDNWAKASKFMGTKRVRDWFGPGEYYFEEEEEKGEISLAGTNIIWKRDEGQWEMLSQLNEVPIGETVLNTTFKSFEARDLNVINDLSEADLSELHEKLLNERKERLQNEEINPINKKLSSFSVDFQKFFDLFGKIKFNDDSLDKGEVGEINKISENVSQENTVNTKNIMLFNKLAGFKETIGSMKKGFFGGYDKEEVKDLKSKLKEAMSNLHHSIVNMIEGVSKTEITYEFPTEDLVSNLKEIQIYCYIFENFVDGGKITPLIDEIKKPNRVKRTIDERERNFEEEKKELFP
ncbi:hypothetical protein [Xanthovirga aplysinae]|uniref:hypothetical protein n=1 Tax=Xanthovirga aplysinae TaxID=2529853 RepID=UPI0012BC62CF|nr:hypothetical protein [Xanthovirga aplysinae]MTI29829.1 hypothetical protein [Xanthovirga aplysinae]